MVLGIYVSELEVQIERASLVDESTMIGCVLGRRPNIVELDLAS